VPDVAKIGTLTGWHARRALVDILDDVIAEARGEGNGRVAAQFRDAAEASSDHSGETTA
jgi:hypothetical protein